MPGNYSPPPKPGPEHHWIAEVVGTWDIQCSYFHQPGAPPLEATGVDHVTMLGPYWRQARFEATVVGTEVTGFASLGYNPVRGHFVGSWYDSANPFLYSYTGNLDAETGKLVMAGTNIDPHTGRETVYRSEETIALPDRRTLDLFVALEDGQDFRVLTYEYTRRD